MKTTLLHHKIYEHVFESLEGILITNTNFEIVKVNNTFTKITGYSEEEILCKNPRILSSGKHDCDFYKKMWKSVRTNGSWTGEIYNKRKNDDIYPERLYISSVKDDDGNIINYIAMFQDITAEKQLEELMKLSFNDQLTGLRNRRKLIFLLEDMLSDLSRCDENFVLMYLDLDKFKDVNDDYGHNIGDELLKEVAKRLTESVRETDIVARLGGDEFVVVVKNLPKDEHRAIEHTKHLADKIIATINEPLVLDDITLKPTTSMGIALAKIGLAPNELLDLADAAMYKAKRAGRNNYVI